MDKPAKRIVMIVGPTAVGKSDLGVYLAQQLHGEVINGDAYQIYRHMDIGTAKITPEEMQGCHTIYWISLTLPSHTRSPSLKRQRRP